MSNFRSDYEVRSSLVLPEGTDTAQLASSVEGIQITLHNAPTRKDGHVPCLIAKVVGPAASLDAVADIHREHLARELDTLAFVTKATFQIEQCTKVIEWEPFQKSRKMLALQKFDPGNPPAPNLLPELLDSAARLSLALDQSSATRRALQCFRLGLISTQSEEQFHQFWLAFETIAEDTKDTARVPIQCPKCRTDLWCSSCAGVPTRRPLAQQAMRTLLTSLRKDGNDVYEILSKVRHHLAHGRSPSTLSKSAGIELPIAVDLMGATAWHSIIRVMPHVDNLTVMEVDSVLSRELIVGPDLEFQYNGEAEHPSDREIPDLNISLQTRFGPLPSQSTVSQSGIGNDPTEGT